MEQHTLENFKAIDFHVKGNLRDLFAFLGIKKYRKKRISTASDAMPESDPYVNRLATALHPSRQYLKIEKIIEETPTTKTFRLVPNPEKGTKSLAYFQAGQYLSVKENVHGHEITRAYSIASSPQDSLNGFYDITIKKLPNGFLTDYIWQNWKIGSEVITSGPMGFMYWSPIRDSKTIVGIAGGSGITPFRSLAREICFGSMKNEDVKMKLIYGCSAENEIIFQKEFEELASKFADRFSFVLVMSCEVVNLKGCETGFITKEIIKKYSDPSKDSYFMCGPALMYDFVTKELEALNVPLKRIRREAYGEIKDPKKFASYPKQAFDKIYTINVRTKSEQISIKANGSESLLVALERAKFKVPSACRSGECQFCRTLLIKGDVWVSPESDGRRQADKKFGYIHPCVSFPLSDLELQLPNSDE
jgi:ferredoxin-NADP reductase